MAVEIGDDGRCKCSAADPCPLGRVGGEVRCSAKELEDAGFKAIYPKMKASHKVWEILREFFSPEFDVKKLLPELVSMVRDRIPALLSQHDALVKSEFYLKAAYDVLERRLEAVQKALDPEACEGISPVEELARQIRMRLENVEEERNRLRSDIRVMIEKAADKKLDGYRELGQRAANAENEADRLRAAMRQLGGAAMSVRRENQIEWLVWFEHEIQKADGVLGQEPSRLPGLKEIKVPYCMYCGGQEDLISMGRGHVCQECSESHLKESSASEGSRSV